MMSGMTRRGLLQAGGGALLTASIAGCDASSTDPIGSGSDAEGVDSLEAPMLADRVEAGDLPPVEERLPDDPLVVEPVDQPGTYGGTWTSAMVGASDMAVLRRTIAYDQLMHFTPDWSDVVPNVAESVDIAGDGREYTFTLRKGLKWSDGNPFTADDLEFAYSDVWLNEELFPVPPSWLLAGGEPPAFEKIDDFTVKFVFAEPHGLFLQRLATPAGTEITALPKHFLQDYHPKYNSDIDSLVADGGYADWTQMWEEVAAIFDNPELPTLWAWNSTSRVSDGQRVVFERNPYYWKVDPDGRQLPYIDQVAYDVVSDEETIILKITDGTINMHARHVNTMGNKPVLAEGRAESGYDFFELTPAIMNEMIIAFNLAHEDPVLREVFQNRDFRIGLSHAINRDELVTVIFQRQGEPWQAAPRRESEFFDEEFAKQYTEFDVDLANEYLDRAGLVDRDDSGFRLRPDGGRLKFDVEIPVPTLKDFWVNAMEVIREQWREIGIDAGIKSEERSLFYERKEANQHDVAIWQGDGGLQDAILEPRWYFPYSLESNYATPWATWFMSGGAEGAEPPPVAQGQMELYRELTATADEEAQAEIFREILNVAKEEFYVIGVVLQSENYGIVADNFRNVPEPLPEAWLYPTPAPAHPEQFFIDESE